MNIQDCPIFGDAIIFRMLQELEFTPSSNQKINTLKKYHFEYGTQFCEFWRLMLSYDVVFGISDKTFEMNETAFSYDEQYKFNSIIELLQYLEENNTGTHQVKRLVLAYGSTLDPFEEYNWFQRILTRNLRVGVEAKTINKVIPPSWVKVFDCALAIQHDKVKDFPVIGKTYYVEPKFDGVRCLAFVTPRSVRLYTRNGSLIENFSDIEYELMELADKNNLQSIVFDGEIVVNGKFKDTTENIFSKKINKVGSYYIFDMIPRSQFEQDFSQGYSELYHRKFGLSKLLIDAGYRYLVAVHGYEIKANSFSTFLKDVNDITLQYQKDGYEGSIVKQSNLPYIAKRGNHWVKFKTFYTEDFEIVGMIEGKGKYEGSLGALQVRNSRTIVEVGSGFTDEQRQEFWDAGEDIVGLYAEVKYQEVIEKTGSLRFPVFIRLRQDL